MSQIENEGSLTLSYDFWLKTLKDSKVGAAKDHCKKFQSRLASSFIGTVPCSDNYVCLKILVTYRLTVNSILSLHQQFLIIVNALCKHCPLFHVIMLTSYWRATFFELTGIFDFITQRSSSYITGWMLPKLNPKSSQFCPFMESQLPGRTHGWWRNFWTQETMQGLISKLENNII